MLIELHGGAQAEPRGQVSENLLGGESKEPVQGHERSWLGPSVTQSLCQLADALLGNWGLMGWGLSWEVLLSLLAASHIGITYSVASTDLASWGEGWAETTRSKHTSLRSQQEAEDISLAMPRHRNKSSPSLASNQLRQVASLCGLGFIPALDQLRAMACAK